jgi:dienelactone hydrolase
MTRVVAILAGSIALAVSAASCVHAESIYIDPLYGVQVSKNHVYGKGISKGQSINLLADVYQPVDIGLAPLLASRPAVVIQDGGAWTSANKNSGRVTTPAQYLAARGFTVIVSDYRQGAPGNSLLGIAPGPHAPVTIGQTQFGNAPYAGLNTNSHIYAIYPGMTPISAGIEDFALAINWTRTNATDLGIDPNRIGIAGGSAGGIDALLLQYNNNPVNPAYRAQAVVALVSTMMNNFNRIQPGGPPVFLLNNTQDQVVPWSPQMSQRFLDVGIYREQWFQAPSLTYHDVDWNLMLGEKNLLEFDPPPSHEPRDPAASNRPFNPDHTPAGGGQCGGASRPVAALC